MSDDGDMEDFRPAELPAGIEKTIIKEAETSAWRTPAKGAELTVHYVGTLQDGTQFDSSRDRDEPIKFTLGEGQVIKGWEQGIPTMRKGEIAKFSFQPELAYGEAGNPPTIPANAVLTFEVELINWLAKDDVFRDGGVIKTITKEGEGWETPKKGEEVRCTFKVLAKNGDVIQEKKSWETIIGKCPLEPEKLAKVVDTVLQDMKLEEKCSLEVEKDYLFEGKGDLTMEMELEAIYEIVDCSFQKDGSVMKKRVFAPEKEYAKPQDNVRVTLRVESVTDGSSPVAGFSGPKEISFLTGAGEVSDALESAVVEMKEGEQAIVTCNVPAQCADDLTGLKDLKGEKVVFTLELLDFGKTKELHAMGGEEKLLLGLQRKEKGGDLFKRKRFELALQKYKKVTELMNQNDGMSKENKQRAVDLKHIAEMNKAACYLQLGDPTNALSICNTILATDRNNVKCILRRAKAHFSRHEHVAAQKDLERVLELEPESSEAKTLLPQVRRAQKVLDKGSASTYKNMFDGLSKVGFGVEKKKPEPVAKKPDPADEVAKDHVAVTFRLEHKIEPGELLFVTGTAEALGEWDATKGIQLKRAPAPPDYEAMALGKAPRETHLWEAGIDLPVELGRTEYKYHVRSPSGDREEGDKHVMQLSGMGGSRLRNSDQWRERKAWEPVEE